MGVIVWNREGSPSAKGGSEMKRENGREEIGEDRDHQTMMQVGIGVSERGEKNERTKETPEDNCERSHGEQRRSSGVENQRRRRTERDRSRASERRKTTKEKRRREKEVRPQEFGERPKTCDLKREWCWQQGRRKHKQKRAWCR